MHRWGSTVTRRELSIVDSHPVEADLAQLRERADLVVGTAGGFKQAFHTMKVWIRRRYPQLACE